MFRQNVSRETNNKQPALRRKIIVQHLQYIEFSFAVISTVKQSNNAYYIPKKQSVLLDFLDKISRLKA